MPENSTWTDERVDRLVGRLLQIGVSTAAAVVVAGGLLYLIRHGGELADHRQFQGEPAELRSLWGIAGAALEIRGRGLIQLGLLLLVATPVLRVLLLAGAFALQRDRLYTLVALLVLGILLFSLFAS